MNPNLNFNQKQAVLHQGGPVLILAGAGSGKTQVITHRIAELLNRGIPAHRILAVTFTNKAAQEMRQRVEALVHQSAKGLWVGTFHSICSRILRIYSDSIGLQKDFQIFDDQDQKNVCSQILKELHLSEHLSPRAVLSAIDQAKNRGQTPDAYWGKDYFTDLVSKIYPIYQKRLREASALDFGDLLLLPLQLIQSNPIFSQELATRFDHVLVDEFQDVNQVQYQFVSHLSKRTRQLFVVGDDDQAIYSWRGADVKNLLQFETDWPDATVIKLEQNYRSTPIILDAANAVIARNRDRFGKQLFSDKKGGTHITYHVAWDERREAAFVIKMIRQLIASENLSLAHCAILYRTNAQSRLLEEALRAANYPYTIVGGMRFYDRAEIRDILAYLRLCHHTNDEVALRRVINVPTRGIGDSTISKIETHARKQNISLWDALLTLLAENGFTSTIHKKVSVFVEIMNRLQQMAKQLKLSSLTEAILTETGYTESLIYESSIESTNRKENIAELIQSIREQENNTDTPLSLGEYLEKVSLASSIDTQGEGISLMTIHASKGLEFDAVFLTGLEDGLFPSIRNQEDTSDNTNSLEEERRLAYVAITRAKKHLFLTYAQQRRLYGQLPRINEPSRFLQDIPSSGLTFIPPEDSSGSYQNSSSFQVEEFSGFPQRDRYKKTLQNSSYSIEYEPQHNESDFYIGQFVEHPQFGQGRIQSISGFGEQIKCIILFEKAGEKTILAKFIKPI